MSRTDWPQLCTLADASRLFAGEGVKVDRSNLSRFVASRGIVKTDGKVDPNALFDAYHNDYGRQTMAGRTGGAAPPPSHLSAPPPNTPPRDVEPGNDPRRDLNRVQARLAQLALDEKLGKTLPVDEVAAALAEAIAELRAAGLRAARDEAARLLADLGAPGHKVGAAVAALKRYAAVMQEAFAASAAALLTASAGSDAEARARLDAITAFALQLRDASAAADTVQDETPAPLAPEPALPG